MSTPEEALAKARRVFRGFALRELSLPAVTTEQLSDDTAHDFLALSLASFEDLMRLTETLQRPSGEGFRIQAGYLDSAHPNARAAARGHVHLVAMNVGLGAAAYEFSLFCLGQSSVLRRFGDAGRERGVSAVEGYPPGFWMREAGAVLDEASFLETARGLMPRDPRRYEVAVLMTVLMTRFIWLHELYHCVNGHVGLVDRHGLSLGFEETAPLRGNAVSAEQLRLMELDADQSALDALCRVTLGDLENVEGLRRLSQHDCLMLGMFAAYGATWMLDEHLRRRDEGASQTHPPPARRRINLIRTFASTVAPAIEDAKALHDDVLAEMTTLSAIAPRFPSGEQLLAEMKDEALQAACDADQASLSRLRADLTPYRYA